MKRRPEKKKHRFLIRKMHLVGYLSYIASFCGYDQYNHVFRSHRIEPRKSLWPGKRGLCPDAFAVRGYSEIARPSFLQKKWQLVIPSRMMILFALFLYSAIYLGEVRDFYYNVPHWDTILHTCSGAMLGALGFSVIHF